MRIALFSLLLLFPLTAHAQAPIAPITPPAAPKAEAPATTRAAEQLGGLRDTQMHPFSSLITNAPLPGDFVLGNRKAKLVMIEYASLSCPHCAHFHNKMLPDLQKEFIDTGKMMFIFRPYPLNESALKASILIDCIGEKQGAERYYTFARVLFDQQSKWAFEGNYMDALQTFASVGGIDKTMFNQCVADPTREMKILNLKKVATDELKIPHTPYFFIGGERYEGERSVEAFTQAIQGRLNKK